MTGGTTEALTSAGTTSATTGEPLECDSLDCAAKHLWSVGFGQGVIHNAAVDVDGAGNIYVGGSYRTGIQFGGEYVAGADTTLSIYVMKLSPDGELKWLKSFGDNADMGGHEELLDLVVADDGRVYFTGSYTGPLLMCGQGLGGSAANPDFYVGKLNGLTGDCEQLAAVLTTGVQRGRALAFDDAADQLVVGGEYQGVEFDLGGGPLLEEQLGAQPSNGFLALYTSDLEHVWSRGVGFYGARDRVDVVTLGPDATLMFAGSFADKINLGDGELHAVQGVTADTFIGRANLLNGTVDWSDALVADGGVTASAMVFDGADSLLLAGEFGGSIEALALDSGAVSTQDIYVLRLNPKTGDVAWALNFGSAAANELARGLALDPVHDHVLLSARCVDTIDFGGGPLSGGSSDACLARLEHGDGAHLWSARYGGNAGGYGEGGLQLAVDVQGDEAALVWAGDYQGMLDLGGDVLIWVGVYTRTFLARFAL
ncbi:MAG: hypothetical protein KC468_35665 [Myxococcales bacterium]|nr:hypothetical protein [Myxococcales bacterium]